jgi:hypothetical protein
MSASQPQGKPELSISHGVTETARIPSRAAGMVDEETVRAARAAIHKRYPSRPQDALDLSDGEAQSEGQKITEAGREALASVELTLPNGMVVLYGPRPGVSITMRLVHMFGDADWTNPTASLFRVLMSVQELNGKSVNVTSRIEGEKLANLLGDSGIDTLFRAQAKYFKSPDQIDLLVIKKNQL